MKKRIFAVVMMLLVVFSCFAITASAATKTIKTSGYSSAYTVGKWKYDCSVLKGTYYSKYNDDTSVNHRYHSISYIMDSKDHASWVRNNKTGSTSGWVYAPCGTYSNATTKASWTGSGSASWHLK